MQPVFILISILLPLISPVVYAKAILKGEAKPHRTTRLVLLLITTLATVSLFAQHDHVAIWLAGVSMLQSIVIFILSIKYGMGGWSKDDLLCLGIALGGILLWQTTKNPAIALYASIAADFTGMVPAVVKTYKFPETEIYAFFLLDAIAAVFNLLAIKVWVPQAFAYPVYLLVINAIMVVIIIRPEKIFHLAMVKKFF